MGGDLQRDSIYTAFVKMYTTRVKLYNKKSALEKEIKDKLKEQNILKTILLQKEDLNKPLSKEFNFTLSKGPDTYFEVLELSFNTLDKKVKDPILIYKSKRTYLSYKEGDINKMVYFCDIEGNKFCITSEDGTQWKGVDVWKKFVESFKQNLEFKSMEHFFGLTYKPVQGRIDKCRSLQL